MTGRERAGTDPDLGRSAGGESATPGQVAAANMVKRALAFGATQPSDEERRAFAEANAMQAIAEVLDA